MLVYFEGCRSKEKAVAREKTLKSGFGRKYIKSRI
jgi:predicted GIY-YIG superfamily endonuclease